MSDQGMDCTSIRDTLLAGSALAGPGVEAHVRDCAACAELLRNQGRLGRALSGAEAPATANPELWKSLEGALAAETGPRAWFRSRATPVRLLLVVFVATVAVFLGGQPADETVKPVEAMLGWLVGFALAALACLWVLVAPLGRPRPSPVVHLLLVGAALALPLVYAAFGSSASRAPGSFAEQAVGCFVYGTILALPFLGVVWLFERSDRPWLTRLVGVGAVGGLVANAALALHCPNTEVGHLVLGHAMVGALLAGAGALFTVARTRASSP
jgi:hypothetical protein